MEKRRRTRRQDKSETQADLRSAALDFLENRGPLAGVTLQEVADAANVNRVQIYQYYGTREALLRAAISELLDAGKPAREPIRKLPFLKRRLAMFDHFLEQGNLAKLEALLAYNGDDEFHVFSELEHAKRNLQDDLEKGHVPPDTDLIVAHIMTSVAYRGYCIYREIAARDAGIPVEELDKRARVVFELMLNGIASGARTPNGTEETELRKARSDSVAKAEP